MAPGARSWGIRPLGWVLVGFALVASASVGFLVGGGALGGSGIVAETALVGLAGAVGGLAVLLATGWFARSPSFSRSSSRSPARSSGRSSARSPVRPFARSLDSSEWSVTAEDVEELAGAAELRVEHAEEELSALVADVRRETLGALRSLRADLNEQRAALARYARQGALPGPPAPAPEPNPVEEVDVDAIVSAMADEADAIPEAPGALHTGGDERPVDDVPGLPAEMAMRLHEQGIHTTRQLCGLDAAMVAARLRSWPNQVRHWQATAELMALHGLAPGDAEALHAAGVDLRDLSRSRPEDVARVLHVGSDDPRARAWVEEARRLVSR